MSFTPIKQIHQHLCAFHVYAYASDLFRCRLLCEHTLKEMLTGKTIHATLRRITSANISLRTSTNASFTTPINPMRDSSASNTLLPKRWAIGILRTCLSHLYDTAIVIDIQVSTWRREEILALAQIRGL